MDKSLDYLDNSIQQNPFQDIAIKRKLDWPFGNIFGENQSGEIVCIYCQILIEKPFLSQHCGEAQHLEVMFKQLEDKMKLYNPLLKKFEIFKILLNRKTDCYNDIKEIIDEFIKEVIVECGIFNNCQRKQNTESVTTIAKLFYYLLIHNIEFIKGEDIVNFVQDEQNVNVQALQQYARQEQISLSNEQLQELREVNFSFIIAPKQDESSLKIQNNYVENLYKFIRDTLNDGYEEVTLVMNLQLASKIRQEKIFHLNYEKIKKSDKNCIIELQNKKILTFDREYLISELQTTFWDNIGKYKNVIGGDILNKRNKINEAFNKVKTNLMNNIGISENEKIYKYFLQQLQIMYYKKCHKINLRKFNLIDKNVKQIFQDSKSKSQKTQEKVHQSKFEKIMKKIIQEDEPIEISNDQFKRQKQQRK